MKKKHGMVMLLICLGLLHLAVFAAGFLSPYDVAEQDRELPFAPPARIHFVDAQGAIHLLSPFVYLMVENSAQFGVYREDTHNCFPIRFFVHGTQYKFADIFTPNIHLLGVDPRRGSFLWEPMATEEIYSPDFSTAGRSHWLRGCWPHCYLWGSGFCWARCQDFMEGGWML